MKRWPYRVLLFYRHQSKTYYHSNPGQKRNLEGELKALMITIPDYMLHSMAFDPLGGRVRQQICDFFNRLPSMEYHQDTVNVFALRSHPEILSVALPSLSELLKHVGDNLHSQRGRVSFREKLKKRGALFPRSWRDPGTSNPNAMVLSMEGIYIN